MNQNLEDQINDLKKSVAYDSKDYTIEILVKKYSEGIDQNENEIYVPDYQREFVWSDIRQSKLIESIILGLPIPPIFVAEGKDGRLEIVDGSQRIRTLNAFTNNELTLSGLDKVTMLNGVTFNALDISRRRKVNNTTLSLIVLSENATDDVKNDLFERINKGSDILRGMETRKGIYQGEFTNFIYNECAIKPEFRSALKLSKTVEKRQEYEELTLRFFALTDLYPKYNEFSRSVSKALDAYMQQKASNFPPEEKEKKLSDFEEMLSFVRSNFKHGFMKGDQKEASRIVFEAISVGTHLALQELPDVQQQSQIDLSQLLRDKEFHKSISGRYQTHSTGSLVKRIGFIKNHIIKNAKK